MAIRCIGRILSRWLESERRIATADGASRSFAAKLGAKKTGRRSLADPLATNSPMATQMPAKASVRNLGDLGGVAEIGVHHYQRTRLRPLGDSVAGTFRFLLRTRHIGILNRLRLDRCQDIRRSHAGRIGERAIAVGPRHWVAVVHRGVQSEIRGNRDVAAQVEVPNRRDPRSTEATQERGAKP